MLRNLLAAIVLLGAAISAQAADNHSMVATAAYHNEDLIGGFRLYLNKPSGGPVWVAPFASRAAYLQFAVIDEVTVGELRWFLKPELALELEMVSGDITSVGAGVDYYLAENNTMAVGAKMEILDNGGADSVVLFATLEAMFAPKLWLDLAYATGDDINDGLRAEAKFFVEDNLYIGARVADGAGSISATEALHQAGGDAILIGYEHEGMFDIEVALNSDSSGIAFNLRF